MVLDGVDSLPFCSGSVRLMSSTLVPAHMNGGRDGLSRICFGCSVFYLYAYEVDYCEEVEGC